MFYFLDRILSLSVCFPLPLLSPILSVFGTLLDGVALLTVCVLHCTRLFVGEKATFRQFLSRANLSPFLGFLSTRAHFLLEAYSPSFSRNRSLLGPGGNEERWERNRRG